MALCGSCAHENARLGLTGQLARWIPAPIVHGLIAGAVMPFVLNVFSSLSMSDSALRVSTYLPVAAGLLIALFAGTAADLAALLPSVLLLTIVGLALVPALAGALREITAGPLGLGPFFWSLVLGTLISVLLERDGWKELRSVEIS